MGLEDGRTCGRGEDKDSRRQVASKQAINKSVNECRRKQGPSLPLLSVVVLFRPFFQTPSPCCSYFKRFGREIERPMEVTWSGKKRKRTRRETETAKYSSTVCIAHPRTPSCSFLPSSSHSSLTTAKLSRLDRVHQRTRPPQSDTLAWATSAVHYFQDDSTFMRRLIIRCMFCYSMRSTTSIVVPLNLPPTSFISPSIAPHQVKIIPILISSQSMTQTSVPNYIPIQMSMALISGQE
jgi:hypothetical protein